jgi:hypothetical protein
MSKLFGLSVLAVLYLLCAGAQQGAIDFELSAAYCAGVAKSNLDASLALRDDDPNMPDDRSGI